jgi:DNA-binding response OmpR family regulator
MLLKIENQGCTIKSASTATEALALSRTHSFDLYILDYRMPDMSGIELCSVIRQTDKQTPIMFFSAMARDIDRKAAIVAGASDYLVKPNDLNRLTKTVKELLSASASTNTGNLLV